MRTIAAVAVLAMALVASGAHAQDTGGRSPSIELPAELDRVLREYERAWAAGDAAGLAALFTEDGFVPTTAGWRRGTEQIRQQYARSGGDLRLRAHEYAASDSVGWIVGAYGYGEAAAQTDSGKFLLALRRAPDGRWLIAADLDNANGERD